MGTEEIKKLLEENKLPADVAKKYTVVGVVPGVIKYKNVAYDLRKIDLATAELLAKDEKFRYLKAIEVSPNASNSAAASK